MDAKQLATYYQTVTETAHMKRISFDSKYAVLDSSDFETRGNLSGIFSGKLTEAALRQVKKDLRLKGDKSVDVLIVPKALQPLGDNAKSNGEAALVIPAKLNGVYLSPNTESEKPYIPRDFLKEQPASYLGLDFLVGLAQTREVSADTPYYLGSFKSYQTYAKSPKTTKFWNNLDQERKSEKWKLYMEHAFAMFDQVVDANLMRAAGSPFELFEDAIFIVEGNLQNPAAPISELYASIKPNAAKPELSLFGALPHALTNAPEQSDTYPQGLESIVAHAGTMENQFPLADSQRKAVHYRALQQDGQVLAVSGPPGTGKTTLLKGIIADLMVKHALAGKSAPLIVGTSTNNQAVTNIIESFAGIGNPDDTNPFYCRWLPDIEPASSTSDDQAPTYVDRPLHSLGVFMPATSKRKAATEKNYLVDNFPTKAEGLYAQCITPEYLQLARTRILRLAQACNLTSSNVAQTAKQIQELLSTVNETRKDLVYHANKYAAYAPDREQHLRVVQTRIRYLNGIGALNAKGEGIDIEALLGTNDAELVVKLDEMLDTTVRPFEFWLALHYFECQWILCSNHLAQDELDKRTQSCFERYWGQLSNLTPLVVMTMFRLPLVFKYISDSHKADTKSFGFGRIDLLIVDEAGQVDTAIGAAALSLAKQAIIVGDVSQLPPVWYVSEVADTLVAEHPLGLKNASDWQAIQTCGLTASQPSSLMRAAQAACPWSYQFEVDGQASHEGGLFLSEHRRCLDSIINYCNDLLYHGLLEPKRGATAKPERTGTPYIELPAMGYVPTTGTSRQLGTSRVNDAEAEAIAAWLHENYPAIRAQYPKTVVKAGAEKNKGIVGIVTPFKAQAKLIREKLKDPKYAFVPLEPNPTGAGSARSSQNAPHPIKLAQEITVGTAHTLQGAERPVVLFSLVYAGSANPAFVESNKELMNVAVSRAKDSFITFADKNKLSQATGDVLRLLWTYCKDDDCSNPEKHLPESESANELKPEAQPKANSEVNPTATPDAKPNTESEDKPAAPLKFPLEENQVLSHLIKLMRQNYPEIDAWFETDRKKKFKWAQLKSASDVQLMNVVFKHAGLLDKQHKAWIPTDKGQHVGIALEHVQTDNKEYDKVVYSVRSAEWIVEHFQEIVADIPLD